MSQGFMRSSKWRTNSPAYYSIDSNVTGNIIKKVINIQHITPHPCANMALNLPQYFYLRMEKPLGCYFQVWSPYYQAAQCNQKTPIPISSGQHVRSEKAKKRYASTLITATNSVYLPKPVSMDLTIKPYSVLTNPIGKDGKTCWFKTSTP